MSHAKHVYTLSVDELVADKQCIIYRVAMPHLHACILVWYTQVYTLAIVSSSVHAIVEGVHNLVHLSVQCVYTFNFLPIIL